jgi:hypothetical protein
LASLKKAAFEGSPSGMLPSSISYTDRSGVVVINRNVVTPGVNDSYTFPTDSSEGHFCARVRYSSATVDQDYILDSLRPFRDDETALEQPGRNRRTATLEVSEHQEHRFIRDLPAFTDTFSLTAYDLQNAVDYIHYILGGQD